MNSQKQKPTIEDSVKNMSEEELRKRKLEFEIKELNRKWYQKPSFQVPIIGAISSLLLLFVTGFFDIKTEALDVKRERLEIDNSKLMGEQKVLKESKFKLMGEQKVLKESKFKLIDEQKVLEESKFIMIDEQKVLEENQVNLLKLEDSLRRINYKLFAKNDSLHVVIRKFDNPRLAVFRYDIPAKKICNIMLMNIGKGPAFIKDIHYYNSGKEVELNNHEEILKEFDIYYDWSGAIWIAPYPDDKESNQRMQISAQDSIPLFYIVPEKHDLYLKNIWMKALSDIKIKIVYTNLANDELFFEYSFN